MKARTRRGGLLGLTAVALLALTTAGAQAGKKAAAPVPPGLEIEVLDPGVHPTGDPAVLLKSTDGGLAQVEIPPTLLVHRFYYTGDRTFQGPRVPGGPCILIFNHPKTGERVYLPAQMLPGAPQVTYSAHAIRYEYGPQSIEVSFGLCGKPKVAYSQQTRLGAAAHDFAENVCAGAKSLVARSNLPECATKTREFARNVVVESVDALSAVGRTVTTPLINASQLIPGAIPLASSPDLQAERLREAELRQAAARSRPEQFLRTER